MELFLQCLFLHARQCTYVIITNEVDSRSTRFSFFVFHEARNCWGEGYVRDSLQSN